MKRFIYDSILKHLPRKQITLLVGARQVGKTTLLQQVEDYFPSNFLKYHYDTAGDQMMFVVTGSSHFYIDQKFTDSMAGRKRIFELPTLGLGEVLHFRGRDDLVPYVGAGQIPQLCKDQMMPHLYDYLVYGGYPEVVLASSLAERKEILRELRNSYVKKDVQDAGLHHPDLYLRLMKIAADQIGSLFNLNALASELSADNKTLLNYLWVMRKSFYVHCARPFHQRVN